MTIAEIIGIIMAVLAILTFVGVFIARITKLETRADVCDEKHRKNEIDHNKQDLVNIKIEEHHVEVMSAISAISTQINLMKK